MHDTVPGNTGSSPWATAAFGLAALSFVAMIITFPSQAFSASLAGLKLWWEYVFPALLPFFILTEIMLGLGVVHALGVLLDPLMRLLFRLPGSGGWAVALSFTSGYPAGAKAAADLRRQGAVSRQEGNVLLALSHVCSPVFLVSVVAVGFWGRAELGLPLLIVHLLSALLTGVIIARFVPRASADSASPTPIPVVHAPLEEDLQPPRSRRNPPLVLRMQDSMVKAQRLDGRALGRLLGESVYSAVQSLLVLGGFIIIISVFLKLLNVSGVGAGVQLALQTLLEPLGMPKQLAEGAFAAIFEIHLGAYGITRTGNAGVWEAAILSSIVAWGGLSVHSQVKSLISGTDLRYKSFLHARVLHSALSLGITFLLWERLQLWLLPWTAAGAVAQKVFFPLQDPLTAPSGGPAMAGAGIGWPQFVNSLGYMALFLSAAVALSLLIRIFDPKRFLHSGRN